MKKIGRLHVLTDMVLQCRFSHADLARMAISGGADTIQFRQKNGPTRWMVETACEIRNICRSGGVPFIVNDRLDVALASEADGVHLGQDDFPIALARKLLGEDRIIGGSAGNVEEALACLSQGADYVGFGPVYSTSSKPDAGPAGGIALLKEVVSSVPIPVVAIGGINVMNGQAVMDAGAWGIAVISSVCCQKDPEEAARSLLSVIS